jgi:tetratricopeptide (TPR) repeat protein
VIGEGLEVGLGGAEPQVLDAARVKQVPKPVVSRLDGPRLAIVLLGACVLLAPPILLLVQRAGADPGARARGAEFDQYIERARILLDAGKARESLIPIERARRLSPDAFAVYTNSCVAYGILARKEEAVLACQRALEIEPGNQLAKNNLAWVQGLPSSEAR